MREKTLYTMDPDEIVTWLGYRDTTKQAKAGSIITYYEGPGLAFERSDYGVLGGTKFDVACSMLYSAAKIGRIHLFQRRLDNGWFQYIAVSRKFNFNQGERNDRGKDQESSPQDELVTA